VRHGSASYNIEQVFPNGEIEHKYIGPHPDQRKTKELQAQGMKINLSLSEMAQVCTTSSVVNHDACSVESLSRSKCTRDSLPQYILLLVRFNCTAIVYHTD
jgi:hypothetical protein